jgi:hypothetical protein
MGTLHNGQRRSTLVYWPASVDERLDLLLDLLRGSGEHASRAQILAALVAAAPLNADTLARQVRAYRQQDEASFTAEHTKPQHPGRGRRRPGPRTPATGNDQPS